MKPTSFVQRWHDLARLTELADWDDEGARAISLPEWARAREITSAVEKSVTSVPAPFPSACGDGTIHVRWSDELRILDLEIDGEQLRWSAEGREGLTRGQSGSLADLIRALRALFSFD